MQSGTGFWSVLGSVVASLFGVQSHKNYERDLDDIPNEVKKSMEIIGVKTIDEVLKIALVKK